MSTREDIITILEPFAGKVVISKKRWNDCIDALEELCCVQRIDELKEVVDMAEMLDGVHPVIPLEKVSERIKLLSEHVK